MKTSIDTTFLVNSQYDTNASLLNSNSDALPPVVNDKHDSLWSNIMYGVGMLAFMVIPPLIPGISTRVIIISLVCVIVGIYTTVGIMAAIRVRNSSRRRKRA